MSEAWDNELIADLEKLFSDAGMDTSVEDISEKKVLVVDFEGKADAEDGNISVEHFSEKTTGISIMFTVASGLDKKASDDIKLLLPYLNKFLTIGSFGLVEPDGYFYFNTSFVIDENADKALLIKIITSTFALAAMTADEAANTTAPVINGEKAVTELMNDDTSIVQT